MSLVTVNIPSPAKLRGGWSALAAIHSAYGMGDIAYATEKEWIYNDMGGNWVCLRFTHEGKVVLFGYDHEYSSVSLTKNNINESPILADTPDWWRNNVFPSPIGEEIGFVYGWEGNMWQRAAYRHEDGFSYAGLLQAIRIKGRHSLYETVEHMFGSANETDIVKLIDEDANVSNSTFSAIAAKDIETGILAARNFLQAPLPDSDTNTNQLENIQHYIAAIESGDFDSIEDCRDQINAQEIPDMIRYYKTLDNWDHKTGCLEVMCDFQDQGGQLKDVLLDYLTVPENLCFPEGRVEIAQITAVCMLDGGDFTTYHSDTQLLHKRVAEILAENGLEKETTTGTGIARRK